MNAPNNLQPQGSTLEVGEVSSETAETISAGGYQTFTGSVEKAGYTPLGIVGFNINAASGGSGQSGCTLYKCYIYYDTTNSIWKYYVSFKNVATSAAKKIYAVLRILYRKN